MSGLILRLAGPLQSWGVSAAFSYRDTAAFPTRSALTGMFAAAAGLGRDADLSVYEPLSFTVRVDRAGVALPDFQTAGGGLPAALTAPTSKGGHRPQGTGVQVLERWYRADAVFVVAVTGPQALIEAVSVALADPVWAPYLGRRACAPDEPLVLRAQCPDPVGELRSQVPLSLGAPPAKAGTVPVTFVWDRAPDGAGAAFEMADVPVSFATLDRVYDTRRLWQTVEHLPAGLYSPAGPDRHIDYVLEHT